MRSRWPGILGAMFVAQFILWLSLGAGLTATAMPLDAVTAATPTTTTTPQTTTTIATTTTVPGPTTTTTASTTTTTTLPLGLTVLYPSDSGITLERGTVCMIQWSATNLPKGAKIRVELVKGGTETWLLSDGAAKSPLKWLLGAPIKGVAAYPDGNDYRIRISPAIGGVSDESDGDFAISGITSITVHGPVSVMCGGAPAQYTCIAHYSFGPDQDVTSLVKWSSIKVKGVKMGKTGLLATTEDVPGRNCTITASYGKGKAPITDSLSITLTSNSEEDGDD